MGMPTPQMFHALCRDLDLRTPLESLLEEFRHGVIADPDRSHEDAVIRSHLAGLHSAWDRTLGLFPDHPGRRRTITWEYFRGRRDAYLKRLLVTAISEYGDGRRLIVNPAAVFGRHARSLARDLPRHEVLATDIQPWFERIFRLVVWWKYRGLQNYAFLRENIFQPDPRRRPAAIVFFGACGSLTDGCMDYAIAVEAPFLLFRSCCHDNIGGNTDIVRRPGFMNSFFAWKNRQYAKLKKKEADLYFSAKYDRNAYPRSRTAREVMNSETVIEVAQNSVDSDICRSLIDLDRCLYLREKGYDVLYREELFFAHRRPQPSEPVRHRT